MNRIELISIAIGILLTGLGVFFGQIDTWGYILVAVAILCFLYVILVEVVKLIPKVYVRPGVAREAAERIYQNAVENGGTILATHIFPSSERMQKDLAAETLKRAKPDKSIEFKRIMILENPLEEKRLIKKFFEEIPSHIDVTLYVLSRYPLGIARLTKTSIPRFNILLHQNEKHYSSLLGLDDLEIPSTPKTNFAIKSANKSAYTSLKSYFSGVTSSPDLVAVQNIQQYESHRSLETISLHAHQTITTLVKFAEQDPRIVFAGLFGSIARTVNDVFPDAASNPQDMDVDVIFVCKEDASIPSIKADLKAKLYDSDFKIVWGDDESEFYSFRDLDKVNVDIELFTRNDDFYKRNILLSYSIFRYFLPLYSKRPSNISDHLVIQKGPLREKSRWHNLIKDRKGYADFKKYLSHFNPNIDPRRALSLILRNFVWAASGHYPATAKISLDYLRFREDIPFDNGLLDMVGVILSASNEQSRVSQFQYLVAVAKTLDILAVYAINKEGIKEEIGEEVANNCMQPTLVPRAADV